MDPGRKETAKGNCLWHADMAFNPRRALYSIIRAVELPPKGSGGETQYLDARTAYEDLPQDLKEEIEPLVCNNSLFHNRKLASPEFFKNVEPLDSPMARHKLVVPHVVPRDGSESDRKMLYLTTYAHHFDGQTMEQSKPLIDRLMKHLTQEKYIYQVNYENNGDMVLWDNTAVLHRATTGGTYGGKYRRDMRRTTVSFSNADGGLGKLLIARDVLKVKDSGKFAWGKNEVGTTWQAGLPLSYDKK